MGFQFVSRAFSSFPSEKKLYLEKHKVSNRVSIFFEHHIIGDLSSATEYIIVPLQPKRDSTNPFAHLVLW